MLFNQFVLKVDEKVFCSKNQLKLIKITLFLDINECSAQSCNPCHQLASCSNLPGTYACGCRDGFHGDGVISCQGR